MAIKMTDFNIAWDGIELVCTSGMPNDKSLPEIQKLFAWRFLVMFLRSPESQQ